MPITKRTLEKWRKKALEDIEKFKAGNPDGAVFYSRAQIILRLTSELLDQHLLRRKEG